MSDEKLHGAAIEIDPDGKVYAVVRHRDIVLKARLPANILQMAPSKAVVYLEEAKGKLNKRLAKVVRAKYITRGKIW